MQLTSEIFNSDEIGQGPILRFSDLVVSFAQFWWNELEGVLSIEGFFRLIVPNALV